MWKKLKAFMNLEPGSGDDKFLPARLAALVESPPSRVVQVDPIKPKLKLPGTKRLKLNCDEPPSNFAFNINLRRYRPARRCARTRGTWRRASRQGLALVPISAQLELFCPPCNPT